MKATVTYFQTLMEYMKAEVSRFVSSVMTICCHTYVLGPIALLVSCKTNQ
jgi:hypothetical protein